MAETENFNWLDVFTPLKKMSKSENTNGDVKQEGLIARAERLAEKIAQEVYAKTAEAQLEAETSIIRTNRDLRRNNERIEIRGKNTRQAEPKAITKENERDDI